MSFMKYQSESLDVDSPAFQCAAYKAQLADLILVDDCFHGQRAIRAGREKYLRRFAGESNSDFKGRNEHSTYWNAYHRTITGWLGTVLRRDPVLKPSVDDKLREVTKNVDMLGTHFDMFARDSLMWSINDGHGAMLIDMPEPITKTNPKATLPDERRLLRPFWGFYRKGQITNWMTETVGGITRLAMVTLSEYVSRKKGKYGQQDVRQYRVLYRDGWELFEHGDNGVVLVDGGYFKTMAGEFLSEIPLAVLACNTRGQLLSSTPCGIDLANENIRHFNLQSQLDNGIGVANVLQPVEECGDDGSSSESLLAGGKLNELPGEKPKRVLSSGKIWTLPHGGKVSYLEPQGNGAKVAQDEIKTTKRNMATLGLTVLFSSDGQAASTATEEDYEHEMESSALGGYVRAAEVGYNRALDLTAEYMGLDKGGECELGRDFTRAKLDGVMVGALAAMTASDPPSLSLETLWGILERGNLLTSDFTATAEAARLLQQAGLLAQIRATVPPATITESVRL